MEIKFYNSLTKKIERFVPLHPNKVSMYVCGPTVYNYPHIGNMRPVVVFDTLRRFFEYVGYEVTYVSNFTDVDDKIIQKAMDEHKSEKEITEFFIAQFEESVHRLGSRDPNLTPKVTEYIPQIVAYVENLVKKDAAYVKNGNVYFRVNKIADYGQLSGISVDDLLSGARVELNDEKESPLDFALWKKAKDGLSWDSPWGKGRPGWHTECCVMVDTIFPPDGKIDIHGGGYDLKFPHHENEIAQSEAQHHNKIANFWLHNNFININDEKMSKSIGNVIYAKDLIEEIGGNVVRMVILSTHYRAPVNFTKETIESAQKEIQKLENVYRQITLVLQMNNVEIPLLEKAQNMEKFLTALGDDLNISNALMELFEIVKKANQILREKELEIEKLKEVFQTIDDMLSILGINIEYVKLNKTDKKLYEDYIEAKKKKNFFHSDELRSQLIKKGII